MTKSGRSGDRKPEPSQDVEPFVVSTIEQVKALTHPLRQRILERFALRARTTKQVADELGEKPTRLYHHVSALERAGLIRLVETRPKRGTTEKYYAAVAERFEIDPRAFSGGSEKLSVRHPTVAVLEGLFENTRSELGRLLEQETVEALAEQAIFIQAELRGDAEWVAAAREKVEALVRELQQASDQDASGSAAHRLILGWYPLPR